MENLGPQDPALVEPPEGCQDLFSILSTNSKHEIRNSKQYIITKIQMTKTPLCAVVFRAYKVDVLFRSLEHSSFGFVSDFDIRISDLAISGASPGNQRGLIMTFPSIQFHRAPASLIKHSFRASRICVSSQFRPTKARAVVRGLS